MARIFRFGLVALAFLVMRLEASAQASYVSYNPVAGYMKLAATGKAAPLVMSSTDFSGVKVAATNLRGDVERVSGTSPLLMEDKLPTDGDIILIGTLGKNAWIDQLVERKRIDVTGIYGKWETSLVQVVDNPFPGINHALVIAGSDKRGTIFGIYDVSGEIGVSPWYWWADVPPAPHTDIFIAPGPHSRGEPAVKYRGIFINDEEPCLGRWAVKNYGGFDHRFYEKVFELILRLRGNYLWPAMWWASFNSDDPLTPELADDYGVVIGTTHHEPMMRAHAEWKKVAGGDWNYETNTARLREFWTEGVRRMGSRESIISVGMRGDGDKAMTAETNIALLERIVADQRQIIRDVTGKDPTQVPQLWALYKEVQEYYDKGMRVPDDVTLLLCDDNWSNVRKLPAIGDKPRAGGYGLYYHFDYVGDPRNYKWLNTCPITKTWEQLHLTYSHGVDRIWIVNVGDIKPLEFPIEFFMDYAWNPSRLNQDNLQEYTRLWAQRQFGAEHASAIADIITSYTQYNARRKPELLAPDTYSLVNYHEAEKVVADYTELFKRAETIYEKLPREQKDAFYELVLHPVKACATLNELYFTVGKNRLYARQGRASTNAVAEKAKSLFQKDAELSTYYNKIMAGGKWDNMMNQVHIGYTIWQDPPENIMPAVQEIVPLAGAEMSVAVEGSDASWPVNKQLVLPSFNRYDRSEHYIEIFNHGAKPFDFTAAADAGWVKLSASKGTIDQDKRILVTVDWTKAPVGKHRRVVNIAGPGGIQVPVHVNLDNPATPALDQVQGHVETNGYVSIEAEHYDRAVNTSGISWTLLPGYGRTLSAMTAFPVSSPSQNPGGVSPRLEYKVFLFDTASVNVKLYLGTTLNFNVTGLRLAVSLDDGAPVTINIHQGETPATWGETVKDNTRVVSRKFKIATAGQHVLKYWVVDPGVVLQKIVIDAGGAKPSYLGPPESFYRLQTTR